MPSISYVLIKNQFRKSLSDRQTDKKKQKQGLA